MNALLAFANQNPVLALFIVGALVSLLAKATATKAPALSAFLYRIVAPFPGDITRMLASGPVTPAQKAEIEKALLDRLAAAAQDALKPSVPPEAKP